MLCHSTHEVGFTEWAKIYLGTGFLDAFPPLLSTELQHSHSSGQGPSWQWRSHGSVGGIPIHPERERLLTTTSGTGHQPLLFPQLDMSGLGNIFTLICFLPLSSFYSKRHQIINLDLLTIFCLLEHFKLITVPFLNHHPELPPSLLFRKIKLPNLTECLLMGHGSRPHTIFFTCLWMCSHCQSSCLGGA